MKHTKSKSVRHPSDARLYRVRCRQPKFAVKTSTEKTRPLKTVSFKSDTTSSVDDSGDQYIEISMNCQTNTSASILR